MILLDQIGSLIYRKQLFNYPELIAIFLGFFLIGFARLSQEKIVVNAINTFLNFKTEIVFSDSIKVNRFGSFVLILNFLTSAALLIFLVSNYYFQYNLSAYIFSLGLAFLIVLLSFLEIFFLQFLTGSANYTAIGNLHNINFIHITGIIALGVSLPWLINPHLSKEFLFFSLILFGFLYLIRLSKFFFFAFRENISLYYIILYLCTLEIFPIYMYVHIYEKFLGF